MRIPIPDLSIGLPIPVLWIGVAILLGLSFLLFQWWRARHPKKPKRRDVSYSKALASRMSGRDLHKPVRRGEKGESGKSAKR